ncbi:MAG: ABC transporter permease [Chloroflexi bacterium]|nr:ABC transporter permease [Chloroflexota bacterium]
METSVGSEVAAALHNIALQAYYSYKGLFLWLNWTAYISNVFIAPVVFVVIVTLTGRFAGQSDSANAYIIGMAAYAIPAILSGGILQSFCYERTFGTLSLIYASRSNRWVTYWSKGLLHYPNGLLAAATSLLFGWLLLDLDFSRLNWPALVVLLLVISFSCLCLCLFVGNFSIALREWIIPVGITNGLLLITSGVVVPVDQLPGFLGEIGRVVPLTHGLSALREAFEGASLGDLVDDIVYELVVGLCYLLAGGFLFSLLEANAKRTGTYESAI